MPDARVLHRSAAATLLVPAESDHGADPGGLHSRLRAMAPAQREVDDGVVCCGQDTPGSLRRDSRLVADLAQQPRLHDLCLRQGSSDLEQRLTGQDDPSFGYRSDLAVEAEADESLHILFTASQSRSEIPGVLFGHLEIGEEAENGLQPRADQKATVAGQITHEQAERRLPGHALP